MRNHGYQGQISPQLATVVVRDRPGPGQARARVPVQLLAGTQICVERSAVRHEAFREELDQWLIADRGWPFDIGYLEAMSDGRLSISELVSTTIGTPREVLGLPKLIATSGRRRPCWWNAMPEPPRWLPTVSQGRPGRHPVPRRRDDGREQAPDSVRGAPAVGGARGFRQRPPGQLRKLVSSSVVNEKDSP